MSKRRSMDSRGMDFVSGTRNQTKKMLRIIMLAKKKKTPHPLGPMLLNIWGVKREMMKFWMMELVLLVDLMGRVESGKVRTYPKPIISRSRSLTKTTSIQVKHFTINDPRSSIPRRSVKSRPQVKEENRCNSTRAQSLTCCCCLCGGRSVFGADVAADNPHAD